MEIIIFCFISNPDGLQETKTLLVAVSILLTAIRALPGDPVASHSPLIFIHAGLADGKTAPAIPAEHDRLSAAMTEFRCLFSTVFFSFFSVLTHSTNILLL